VIWAAGVAASPLGRALAETTGVALDRAGRVTVQPDLSIVGFPTITVIGDLAAARSHAKGLTNDVALSRTESTAPVPGVSPAAKQMGRLTATNLMHRLRGEPTRAFHYADYGNLATVGRHAAVVDLTVPVFGALRFSGTLAWWFWLLAHVYFLIGFRNRLIVLLDWGVAYWTYERSARVVAQPASTGVYSHTAVAPDASTPAAALTSASAGATNVAHS
jgi:NADH dehydrogenase